MDYKPTGVCSRLIHVELDGDKIANVEFVGVRNPLLAAVAAMERASISATDAICPL